MNLEDEDMEFLDGKWEKEVCGWEELLSPAIVGKEAVIE